MATQTDVELLADYEGQVKGSLRRNFLMILMDGILFHLSLAFSHETTIVPVFISAIGGSRVMVGIISSIRLGGWYSPQLFAAGYFGHRQRKKLLIVIMNIIGRTFFIPFLLVVYFYGMRNPTLLIISFTLAIAAVNIGDGLVGALWLDLLAKCIPLNYRGRLLGGRQVLGGLLAVAAGFLIKYILELPSLEFPRNYFWIFFICFSLLISGISFNLLIKEPIYPFKAERKASFLEFLRSLKILIRKDKVFNRLIYVKLLGVFSTMALPFYILYAREVLNMEAGIIGLFISFNMIGKTIASLIWGYISDKISNKLVIQLVLASMLIAPLSALVLTLLVNYDLISGGANIVKYIYLGIFFILGVVIGGEWMGFINFTLEIADPLERPSYIAVNNSMGIPIMILPAIGGLIVQYISYSAVFALVTIFVATALILSFSLKDPRSKDISY